MYNAADIDDILLNNNTISDRVQVPVLYIFHRDFSVDSLVTSHLLANVSEQDCLSYDDVCYFRTMAEMMLSEPAKYFSFILKEELRQSEKALYAKLNDVHGMLSSADNIEYSVSSSFAEYFSDDLAEHYPEPAAVLVSTDVGVGYDKKKRSDVIAYADKNDAPIVIVAQNSYYDPFGLLQIRDEWDAKCIFVKGDRSSSGSMYVICDALSLHAETAREWLSEQCSGSKATPFYFHGQGS